MARAFRMMVLAPTLALLTACGGGGASPSTPYLTGGTAKNSVSTNSTSPTTNSYTIGGTVSGMLGNGLTLQLNGGSPLTLSVNGVFIFPGAIQSGSNYVVTIAAQPSDPSQICVLNSASGTVGSSAITNVLVTCTDPPIQFAYVGSNVGIYCFAVDAIGGTLVPLANPQCDSGLLSEVAADPSGQFLYATDNPPSLVVLPPPNMIPDGYIRMYRIDSTTGGLVPLAGTEPSAQVNPVAITVDPSGRFVYAVNYGSDNISAYVIDPATGLLMAMPGSPFAAGHLPNALAIDPSGKFLYTANQGSGDVSAFVINPSTGDLTPAPGSPFASGNGAAAIAIDPASRFVFVANGGNTFLGTGTFSGFQIDSGTGALSPVPGSPFMAGNSPSGVVFDTSGVFLYVTNGNCPDPLTIPKGDGCNTISGYAIAASTGALTPLPGFPLDTPGVSSPQGPAVQGQVLYFCNGGVGTISMFAIDETTGVLTQLSGSPVIAAGAGSPSYNIAFAP